MVSIFAGQLAMHCFDLSTYTVWVLCAFIQTHSLQRKEVYLPENSDQQKTGQSCLFWKAISWIGLTNNVLLTMLFFLEQTTAIPTIHDGIK